MSSAALPRVALSKPPIPGPIDSARHSVARPMRPARGTMAAVDKRKIHSSPRCITLKVMAAGHVAIQCEDTSNERIDITANHVQTTDGLSLGDDVKGAVAVDRHG